MKTFCTVFSIFMHTIVAVAGMLLAQYLSHSGPEWVISNNGKISEVTGIASGLITFASFVSCIFTLVKINE